MVSPKTRVSPAAMRQLASLANTKTSLAGRPYTFLAPICAVVSNEAGMLNAWSCNLGEAPGGLCIRTDQMKAYQLRTGEYLSHKVRGNWSEYPQLTVAATQSSLGAGTVGALAYTLDAGLVRYTGSVWQPYVGWRAELRRLRAAIFNNYPVDEDGVRLEVNGELFYGAQCALGVHTERRFAYSIINGRDWNQFPIWAFGPTDYVFTTDNNTVVEISSPLTFIEHARQATATRAVFRFRAEFGQIAPKLRFTIIVRSDQNTAEHTLTGSGSFLITRQQAVNFPPGNLGYTLFHCEDVEWGGGEVELVITGRRTLAQGAATFDSSGRIYWHVSQKLLATQHIHDGSDLQKIELPYNSTTGFPLAFWVLNQRPQDGGPDSGRDVWNRRNQPFIAMPIAGNTTNGYFHARPLPLIGVNADEKSSVTGATFGQSILARYAKQSTAAVESVVGAIDPPYEVSQLIDYKVPRAYYRRSDDDPNTIKLAMFGASNIRITPGSTVYSVTVKRLPAPDDPDGTPRKGSGITVRLGFIREGRFVLLRSIALPAGFEAATIYPDWINFTQDSLCYTSTGNERIDVQAMLCLPNPPIAGKRYISNNNQVLTDLPYGSPIMAFHYNDTEAMLNAFR